VVGVENRRTRVRGLDPRAVDFVVAGCLAVLALALFSATAHPFPAAVFGMLGATAVATRRRAPRLSIVTLAVSSVLIAFTDHGVGQPTQAIVATLCFYTLGCCADRGIGQLVDVALLALAVVVTAVSPPRSASSVALTWTCFVALPYLAGRTVASRRALTAELEANAERARHEQEVRARSAAAEERTRIARELHDVIAHSLSVMVIQTVAAREVATADPSSARTALSAVQVAGREALLEMRQMIGVLRHGDVELAGSAAPGLDQLDLLAQRARMSGLPVKLAFNGRRRALSEALDLVAFRVVQEALTNSIKHAGPACATVTVTFREDTLELEICDDGRGASREHPAEAGGGHGLVGMRERLALFDGELSTGRQLDGGFRVYACLPVVEAAAT
jgi:signal transduction histidine kinase